MLDARPHGRVDGSDVLRPALSGFRIDGRDDEQTIETRIGLRKAFGLVVVPESSLSRSRDGFGRARDMREGLEPEVSVVVDVMYPMAGLIRAAGSSRKVYPYTPLRLYVEALGGVVQPILNGTCRIGIMGSLPTVPDELQSEPLLDVPFVTVVSPEHPLAKVRGVISKAALEEQVQLVLTDCTALTEGRNFGVLSPMTWRLADLGAKHAFLRAGFGWGHMPLHMVEEDLKRKRLVTITVAGLKPKMPFFMPMRVVYRKETPPGPASQAFISNLRGDSRLVGSTQEARPPRRPAPRGSRDPCTQICSGQIEGHEGRLTSRR